MLETHAGTVLDPDNQPDFKAVYGRHDGRAPPALSHSAARVNSPGAGPRLPHSTADYSRLRQRREPMIHVSLP
jgi:hypothetical protein